MKFNTYKFLKKIFIALLNNFLLINCCLLPVERTWTDEYVIENNTNQEVKIFYRFKTDDIIPEIRTDSMIINANSEYRKNKSKGFHGDAPGIFPVTTDSVVIKFGNEKAIIQQCDRFLDVSCNVTRDIVNYTDEQNYRRTTIDKKCGTESFRYTYTITQEDYNNAVPIVE